jgi:sugar phosphate isomerase/epimerase
MQESTEFRLEQDLPRAIERITTVQVSDYRDPTRGRMDRVLAGDGVAGVASLLARLRALGFDGWYDLELFSDDGTFGEDYPDSLWRLPPAEFARRQVAALRASLAAG